MDRVWRKVTSKCDHVKSCNLHFSLCFDQQQHMLSALLTQRAYSQHICNILFAVYFVPLSNGSYTVFYDNVYNMSSFDKFNVHR